MAAPRYTVEDSIARLDSDWISIETLKGWLHHCDKNHGSKCKPPISGPAAPAVTEMTSDTKSVRQKLRLPSSRPWRTTTTKEMAQTNSTRASIRGRPQWLIDVEKACLVPAEALDQYAALSYVWGQVPMFKAVRQNLAQLRVEGAIRDLGSLIPNTIRHAIELTRLLEIRFIWIDCLCIVQDDDENLYSQLQDMASIFAAAYVTIVAANGWDANHGLRGIQGVSDPRQLSGNFNLYESLQPHSSIWYSRGWTFQEMVFSRRTIMLQYQLAIWGCRSAAWHEGTWDLEASSESLRALHISKWSRRPVVNYPDAEAYINLVREYNNRALTFQSDAYPAITGLLSTWTQSFDGGFVSGLPRMFFESALLWQPYEPLQRRVQRSPQPPQYHSPSWSWLGWQGELDTGEWSTKWDFIRPFTGYHSFEPRIYSIHQWYCGNDVKEMTPIEISSKRFADCTTDFSKGLADGWRRGKYQKKGFHYIVYVHDRFPDVLFPYPIPLPEEGYRSPVEPPVKFLSCRTQRGFLRGTYGRFEARTDVVCFDAKLDATEDDMLSLDVGFIRMHDSENWQPRQVYELVALSRSVLLDGDQGSTLGNAWRKRLPPGTVELCNVMWIEWHDGIAYRKGIGQVRQEIWDSLKLEWIDLILG